MVRKGFGTKRLKRLAARICTCLMAVYVPFAIAAFISDMMTDSNEYAAIMLSAHAVTDYDYWAPPLAFLGSYPAWTLYFNSKGLRTDYFFGATTQDFLNVLENEKYQSIVLVGHGSYNSWRATDDSVENDTIKAMDGRFKKKKGEWFQLTCPVQDYSPVQLGHLVMAHGRSYYYSGQGAGFYDFVTDALTAFWHIKRETKKREHIGTDSQGDRDQAGKPFPEFDNGIENVHWVGLKLRYLIMSGG